MISREITDGLQKQLASFSAVVLIGPRQSGKTTLVRSIAPGKPYFNFETPSTEDRFLADPEAFLSEIKLTGAIFDEVQRVPQIMRYLQQIIDEDRAPGKFLITGSQNIFLNQQVTQSLAGRVAVESLFPFTCSEFPVEQTEDYWKRIFAGAYPQVLTADVDPVSWYQNYIHTYVERDVRQLKNIGNLVMFRAFLKSIASRTAQLINKKQIADDLGTSDTTIAEWLSLLEATYLSFLIPAWVPSVSKRYSHATKLLMVDSGVPASLLGFLSAEDLSRFSFSGFVFENWVAVEIIKSSLHRALHYQFFYVRNYRNHEIDLVAKRGDQTIGIEIKSAKTFSTSLLEDFASLERSGTKFTRKVLVWGGKEAFHSQGVEVIPWFLASTIL